MKLFFMIFLLTGLTAKAKELACQRSTMIGTGFGLLEVHVPDSNNLILTFIDTPDFNSPQQIEAVKTSEIEPGHSLFASPQLKDYQIDFDQFLLEDSQNPPIFESGFLFFHRIDFSETFSYWCQLKS